MITYKFLEEWDEDVGVTWWKTSRTKLNVIIRMYNQWQIDGFPDSEKQKLLANIEFGIQTIGSQDGGLGYREELQKMRDFVEQN